jgi:hypothetical protein
MGSSRRWWLNQDTHSSVANSTAALVFHGARRWINSALYSPLMVSAKAPVITVALAADRGFDAGFSKPLGVPDADVLRPSVAVANQASITLGLPGIQGLLQRIEHEVGPHRTTHPPAHDTTGEHVDDEGHVQPALPGRDIREVAGPQLVRPLGPELPVDPVQRTRCLGIPVGGANDVASESPRLY